MTKLTELLLQYPWAVAFTLLGSVLIILYLIHRAAWDFWFMNAAYGFPVIGKLHRLARDRSVRQTEGGFLHSEATLCEDYEQHIKFLSRPAFEQRTEYLRKAGDNGRAPIPGWLICVLVLLVAAEAYGFSYLLAGFIGDNLSEVARQAATLAIVIVLCVGLVLMTHHAGHHLRKIHLVSQCERDWDEKDRPGDLETHNVSLNMDQSIDDKLNGQPVPDYKQRINRIGRDKGWTWVIGALVIILALGVLQVKLRMDAGERAQIEETIGVAPPPAATADLPDYLRAAQQAPDAKASKEQKQVVKSEWMFGALTLTVIYLMTQGVGLFTGYAYGFAGRDSTEAYKETRGAATYDKYRTRVDRWIGVAEARLTSLQHGIQRRIHNTGIPLNQTFRDYLKMARRRDREFDADPHMGAGAPVDLRAPVDEFAALLTQVRALDAERAKALIRGLPSEVREKVQVALRAAKDAEKTEKQAKLDADLDDLL